MIDILPVNHLTYTCVVFIFSVGLDQYGEVSHPSMYYDLWINAPKCNNEYPDYTFEEHFGKVLPAYVPRAVIRDYIEGKYANELTNRTRVESLYFLFISFNP